MRHLLEKLYWGGTILRGRLEGCASSAIELMASFELSETLSWRDNERHLRRIRDFLPVPYRLHPWLPERDLFRSIGIIGWKRERENWKPHPSRSNLPAGYNCKQQDGGNHVRNTKPPSGEEFPTDATTFASIEKTKKKLSPSKDYSHFWEFYRTDLFTPLSIAIVLNELR